MDAGAIVTHLAQTGLLPVHDARVSSVTALVAGAPVSGSWWSHAAGNRIFNTIEEISAHDDVEVVKLLGGKLTMVHRRLWLALLAVATTGEVTGRDSPVLAQIEAAGSLRARALGADRKVADGLADRLVVFSTSIHTESGRHERVFESWTSWRRRRNVAGRRPSVTSAKAALEEAARPFAPLRLPWGGPVRVGR